MQPYSKKVMQLFTHPKNVGEIKDADGVGKVGNPVCGDLMYVYIKVGKKNRKEFIKDIKEDDEVDEECKEYQVTNALKKISEYGNSYSKVRNEETIQLVSYLLLSLLSKLYITNTNSKKMFLL